jgi:hypothetical protein
MCLENFGLFILEYKIGADIFYFDSRFICVWNFFNYNIFILIVLLVAYMVCLDTSILTKV